jgi:hypothetical protein
MIISFKTALSIVSIVWIMWGITSMVLVDIHGLLLGILGSIVLLVWGPFMITALFYNFRKEFTKGLIP